MQKLQKNKLEINFVKVSLCRSILKLYKAMLDFK
jgi:hypothetical protein